MKMRWLIIILGGLGVLTTSAVLTIKNKRSPISKYFPLKSAGKPDQTDRFDDTQMENSKMVSEGSVFGVQYYNEMAEEHE